MTAYELYREGILAEVAQCVRTVNGAAVEQAAGLLAGAKRIFCEGKGRSGLVLASFAMRLAQMGVTAYVVSETTTPAIRRSDALVLCSGSGTSPELLRHAQKARSVGARTVVMTGNPKSPLLEGAGETLLIHAPQKQEIGAGSIQPMSTLFEQASAIVLDSIVLLLMDELPMTSGEMLENHRNLE